MAIMEKARDDYNAELAIARKNVGKLFDNFDELEDFDEPEEETLTIYKNEQTDTSDDSIFIFEEESVERPLPKPKPAIKVNTAAIDAALAAKGIRRAPVISQEEAQEEEKPESPERYKRAERYERAERPERPERPYIIHRAPERDGSQNRSERPERAASERVENIEQSERDELLGRRTGSYRDSLRFERPERPEHRPLLERLERPERLERSPQPKRPERPERPEWLEHSFNNQDTEILPDKPERPRYDSRRTPKREAAAPLPAFFRGIAVGLTMLFMLLLAFLVYNNITLGSQLQEAQMQISTMVPYYEQRLTALGLELQSTQEELAALTAPGTVPAAGEEGEAREYGETDEAGAPLVDSEDSAEAAAEGAPEQPAAQPEAGTPAGQRTHTVVPGDNLSRIARQFYGSTDNSYIQRIVDANNIADAGMISPGMQLIIP